NGGRFSQFGGVEIGQSGNSNALWVTGPGSVLELFGGNAQILIGQLGGSYNNLTISNGGTVNMGGSGTITYVGASAGANSNSVVIAANNAAMNLNGGGLTIGYYNSTGNSVTVNSGGILSN